MKTLFLKQTNIRRV